MSLSVQDSIERAKSFAEQWPLAEVCCLKCHSWFPLVISGASSIWCVKCDSADYVIIPHRGPNAAKIQEQEKEEKEKAERKSENEQDAGRCDPPGLDDVIGNERSIRWLKTVLSAFRYDLSKLVKGSKEYKRLPFPHTLMAGSGGTGKTMISEIIAREIERPIRLQMGQTLTSPARVGDVLRSLHAGDVLFVDEIHGMKVPSQETLYRAMEDRIYVPVRKAGEPVTDPIRLPPFTLIGSTTDEWALMPSMLQRFRVRIRMERLTAEEISRAMLDRASRKGLTLSDEAAQMIGERSHGTPRLAIGLLDGCVATAKANGESSIDGAVVEMTCSLLGIDQFGLDAVSRKYLQYLSEGNGKPVRLNVLATRLDGLSRLTVERRIEPDLVYLGLVEKTANGRVLTRAGEKHVQEQE